MRAFVRGCALREKTSPLDIPKTKPHELTSFLSQEGAGAALAAPTGARRAAGHPGQPHLAPQGRAGPGRALLLQLQIPPGASDRAGRPHARTEPLPGGKS